MEKPGELRKEAGGNTSANNLVWYQSKGDVETAGNTRVEARMEDIALTALHVDDDPTLNPWTFRMWFLGVYVHKSRLLYANIQQVLGSLDSAQP
jgi:hypothetical protein